MAEDNTCLMTNMLTRTMLKARFSRKKAGFDCVVILPLKPV